jgi:hypothetical protein
MYVLIPVTFKSGPSPPPSSHPFPHPAPPLPPLADNRNSQTKHYPTPGLVMTYDVSTASNDSFIVHMYELRVDSGGVGGGGGGCHNELARFYASKIGARDSASQSEEANESREARFDKCGEVSRQISCYKSLHNNKKSQIRHTVLQTGSANQMRQISHMTYENQWVLGIMPQVPV